MSLALNSPLASPKADRAVLQCPSRYTVKSRLGSSGRAEVLLCLAEDRVAEDKRVVIKWFPRQHPRALFELTEELEFAGQLNHPNVLQTWSIGFELGRYFSVSEYLEGTTLLALLHCAVLSGQRLPNAALARILLAVVDAADHASAVAEVVESVTARALVHQVIGADDVFITHDGDVKVLGFKSVLGADGRPSPTPKAAAIEALLSQHLTPELSAVLAGLSPVGNAPPVERLGRVSGALHAWQSRSLRSDGRSELAALLANVLPGVRALRLGFAPKDDASPVSGLRLRQR